MEFTYTCKTVLDGHSESWIGTIRPLSATDCTEYEISARGSGFHLLIGRHYYGRYIYIPIWNIAMDISYLDDRFWNREQLQRNYPDLSPADTVSIVEALAAIKKQNI